MSSVEPNHSSSEINCTEKVDFELVVTSGDRTDLRGIYLDNANFIRVFTFVSAIAVIGGLA
ncbi:MAG: hypothetical protein V7K40_26940 [Nostoc sp.]|uniref:hypothetical protein n=1 Tax=Nostoc sp. TaxID=1180 RepID=UPI002FF87FCE